MHNNYHLQQSCPRTPALALINIPFSLSHTHRHTHLIHQANISVACHTVSFTTCSTLLPLRYCTSHDNKHSHMYTQTLPANANKQMIQKGRGLKLSGRRAEWTDSFNRRSGKDTHRDFMAIRHIISSFNIVFMQHHWSWECWWEERQYMGGEPTVLCATGNKNSQTHCIFIQINTAMLRDFFQNDKKILPN